MKNAKKQQKPRKKVARAKIARAKERTDRHTNTQIKRLADSIIYSKVIQHVHFVKFSLNLAKTAFHVDKIDIFYIYPPKICYFCLNFRRFWL